ncbi:MAG: type I methionyl aminopeptidase [Patescibacteria group bacterium]|nr:type I methionyl aminopeptidase [Patescibacteria group bacterium]
MTQIKTPQEIKIMAQGGKILAKVLDELKHELKPGVTTASINEKAEKLIRSYGAKPAFKGFEGYPYATCISINEEIVHGLPSSRVIKPGDVVSVDCGVLFGGYNSDAAFTVSIGKVKPEIERLITTTQDTLDLAIFLIKNGASLRSIQKKMQDFVHHAGFTIIRELTGHGIGKKLQEEPVIANYPYGAKDIILKTGMTFCVEPMLSCGDWRIKCTDRDWAIETADKSMSAHFEHTLTVTQFGCRVLTALDEKYY